MHAFLRAPRALIALVACTALVFGAATTAWADDVEDHDELETSPVIVTEGGTQTVRIQTGKDGKFVVVPAGESPEGSRARMHVVVRKGEQDGEVQVLELKDGKWVHGGKPTQVEHEVFVHRGPATTTTFGLAGESRNPMSTVMRWLLTDGMAGGLPKDPLKAWFDGGADVPMPGLRDALKRDGWTADSLQAWFLQHLLGGMAAMSSPAHAPRSHPPHAMHGPGHGHARGPARTHWFGVGRSAKQCNSCDCDCAHRVHDRGVHGRKGHGCQEHGRRGHGDCHTPRHGHGDCGCRKARGHGHGHAQRGCGSCDQRSRCHADHGSCRSCDQRGSCGYGSCRNDCGSCNQHGSCKSRCGSRDQGRCGSCDKREGCRSCKGNCGSRKGRCDSRGSCGGDCGSCDKRGRCGSCDGDCNAKGRGPARRQAYMLWNDGSGWKQRKVDDQGPVAHWGHAHPGPEGMTFEGEEGHAAPELIRVLSALTGETHAQPGSAQIVVEGLDLLPAELLEHVPPGLLENVLKELDGLGLGDVLAPTKKGDCDSCPNKGSCKGGDCDKGASKPAKDCCGTCKGDCADCPKAADGSCAGNCEDCPNKKKGAEKKACCGTCGGGAK